MTSDSSTHDSFGTAAHHDHAVQDASHGGGRSSVGGLFIAAIVAGFIVFWPIGLALLGWALWRDQIMQWKIVRRFMDGDLPAMPAMPKGMNARAFSGLMARKPANSALAEYLSGEQERLHAEQQKLDELVKAFEAFKSAEQQSRDRQDFEAFLRQRETGSEQAPGAAGTARD